jgi:hypothetical protein
MVIARVLARFDCFGADSGHADSIESKLRSGRSASDGVADLVSRTNTKRIPREEIK